MAEGALAGGTGRAGGRAGTCGSRRQMKVRSREGMGPRRRWRLHLRRLGTVQFFFERRRGWVQRVHDVGMCVVGEKNNLFLAETFSKLRFLVLHSPSTLSTSKNIWHVGPTWGVRWDRLRWEKFTSVFAPYSIIIIKYKIYIEDR
jgi:hypothetical protein